MFSNYKFDISYIFGQGRAKKINSNNNFGKEFFYGYHFFLEKGYKLNIIESDINKTSYLKPVLRMLDKYLAKFTKLTFYMTAFINRKALNQIYHSKNIITSNHGIGMTVFIFISIMKRFKKINFIVILSGLFAMKKSNLIVRVCRKLIFLWFLLTVDYLVFTSRSEYEFAINKHTRFKHKFVCLPFSLDTSFWTPSKKVDFSSKKGVLFIGSNGHRDFNLVIDIAKELKDIPFTFITNVILDEQIKSDNVKNIKGEWGREYLTDSEIKEYYESAKITILPINNTLVSSGQSAGLQSASVGTPLMTTETIGFWDYKFYNHEENIIFVKENSLDLWVNLLSNLYNNKEKLEHLSKNGIQLVNSKYDINKFNLSLEQYIVDE